VHRLFLGRSAADHRAHLASMGIELEADFGEIKDRAYIDKARGRLRPMKSALDLVARLHRRTKMAVATSGTPEKVAFSLRETGLDRFFEVVVSASEVARGKPFPDLFLRAAERLGVEPAECVVVEDSGPGIRAARSAGMFAVGLSSSLPRAALLEAGANVVLDDLTALLEHLA